MGSHGFRPLVYSDRSNGKLVGRGGLKPRPQSGVTKVEIGWSIHPDRWGEGLATELARDRCGPRFGTLLGPTA